MYICIYIFISKYNLLNYFTVFSLLNADLRILDNFTYFIFALLDICADDIEILTR